MTTHRPAPRSAVPGSMHIAHRLTTGLAGMVAAATLCATPAPASAAPTAVPASQATDADRALLQALGGPAGLRAAMDDLVARLKADPAIGHFFKDTKSAFLAGQLSDQICQLLGGPCVYDGETMRRSHEELGIRPADFNRLVELLQDTLDARQVPFPVQRALLARLAPMHRDVVGARPAAD